MKIFKALFTLFIALFFASPAQARPIHASLWRNPITKQEVACFGDQHWTYMYSGETSEIELASACLESFKKTTEKCLLLIENPSTQPLTKEWHDNLIKSQGDADNSKTFIPHLLELLKSSPLSHLEINNIDLRAATFLFINVLQLHERILNTREDFPHISVEEFQSQHCHNEFVLLEQGRKMLGNISIKQILQTPIATYQNFMSKASTTPHIKQLFEELLKSAHSYNSEFIQLLQEMDLPKEFVMATTVDDILTNTSLNSQPDTEIYDKYKELLAQFSARRYFNISKNPEHKSPEIITLHHIATTTPTTKKIIVIAGNNHINATEKQLPSLGYEQIENTGVPAKSNTPCHISHNYFSWISESSSLEGKLRTTVEQVNGGRFIIDPFGSFVWKPYIESQD